MKKIALHLIVAISILTFASSCKEVGPSIDFGTAENFDDTTYLLTTIPPAQNKNALIEELTGVKCANCPVGHQLVKDLKASYPNKIISTANHTNFLGSPYPGNPDLRNAKAEDLISSSNYGPLTDKPSAMIDRTINPANNAYLQLKGVWSSAVAGQLSKTTPVNITIVNKFDSITRELKVKVIAQFTQTVSENLKIVVALTENDIVAQQLQPDNTLLANYVHQDVLRDYLTLNIGNSLNTTTEAGRVVIRNYTTTLPADWNANNMHAVAFVQKSVSSKEVLQVAEEKLK